MIFEDTLENKEVYAPSFEIGTFEDIESSIVFSAISKRIEDKWGGEQNEELASGVKNQKLSIPENVHDSYQKIRALAKENDETLGWLAFATQKDQKTQSYIIEQIVTHKNFTQESAKALLRAFEEFYQKAKQAMETSRFAEFVNADIDARNQRFPNVKERVGEAIRFFKPQASHIKRVVYLPTNPLANKFSGYGIEVGESFYISAEHGNDVNEVHEFLHSIINPAAEKVLLTEADEAAILALCPEKLKSYKYPMSILIEEIIRTYHTGFRPENKPSFENFKKKLRAAKREDLEEVLSKQRLKGDVSVTDVDELLQSDDVMKKCYVRYGQDILAERIWNFFEEYQKSNVSSFEDFFMANYKRLFV